VADFGQYRIFGAGPFPAEMSVASAQTMAAFVKLLLDQAEHQDKIREGKKDEAAN